MTAECEAVNVNTNGTGVNNIMSNMARVWNVTSGIEWPQPIKGSGKRSGRMCRDKVRQAQNQKHAASEGRVRTSCEAAPERWRVSPRRRFPFADVGVADRNTSHVDPLQECH